MRILVVDLLCNSPYYCAPLVAALNAAGATAELASPQFYLEPSYLAGVMKPDPGIYREAERRFALEPPATVFIDDRADNVAAAGARGWAGIVHRDYAATLADLRRLGVAC